MPTVHPAVDALFGEFKDAYGVLHKPDGMITSSTTLDPNDTALIVCEDGSIQLFLPESGEMTDKALAVVEIYNAMCRDDKGSKDKKYAGLIAGHADTMKARLE